MYSVLIELKSGLPEETLEQLRVIIESAFDNRVGKVENSCAERGKFEFTGGEEAYPCLDLGSVLLDDSELFWKWVKSWQWIDDDPDESCDIMEEFSIPVR